MVDFTVNSTISLLTPDPSTDPYDVTTARLVDGGFVMVWIDTVNSNVGDLVAQVFNGDGTPRGGRIDVPDGGKSYALSNSTFAVSALSNGNFVIAWEEFAETSNPDDGIHARMYGADSAPVTDEFLFGTQSSPQLAATADGGFRASWTVKNSTTELNDVVTGQFDKFGNAVGSQLTVFTGYDVRTELGENIFSVSSHVGQSVGLANFADGSFVVSWIVDTSTSTTLTVRSFSSAGQPLGDEVIVAQAQHVPFGGAAIAHGVKLKVIDADRFAVSWNDTDGSYGDRSGQGVVAAIFSKQGELLGDFQVNVVTSGNQHNLDMVPIGNGHLLFAYNDEANASTYVVARNIDESSLVYRFGEQVSPEKLLYLKTGPFTRSSIEELLPLANGTVQYTAILWKQGGSGFDYAISSGTITTVAGLVQSGTGAAEIISGTAADDVLAGIGGNDTLVGQSGDDRLLGDQGNDVLQGGDGRDVLFGDEGADTLQGGADNDYLDGGNGPDWMEGGAGDDVYFVDDLGDTVIELPGEGHDIVGATANFVMPDGVDDLYILDDAGYAVMGNGMANELNGGDGSDTIDGNGGDDWINGRAGNDVLRGGTGSDRLLGETGNDEMHGGDGDDSLSGGGGADLLDGGPGFDAVYYFYAGGVVIDLDQPELNTGEAEGDTFLDIEKFLGSLGDDRLIGSDQAGDWLYGSYGNDTMAGRGGNDTLEGAGGLDTAVYAGTRSAAVISRNANHILTIAAGANGVDTVSGVEQLQFDDGLFSLQFSGPRGVLLANFSAGPGGWSSQNLFPRHLADVNGDRLTDIVGFGHSGLLVSYGTPNGKFGEPVLALANFGQTAGWASDNGFHREVADVNGDGRADIVGFGYAGTLVSIAFSNGTFSAPSLDLSDFGVDQGWVSQDEFARATGDFNGDGKTDIIGFGYSGALVSINYGYEFDTFHRPALALANFGFDQGWNSDTKFHRAIGDVNGDGYDDIIGFGYAGTYVALSHGNGMFGTAELVLNNFGVQQGWTTQNTTPRMVADVNGDGLADIVAFGVAGTYLAFGLEDGTFSAVSFDLGDFSTTQGWSSDTIYPRQLADIDNDGRIDIVGFGASGVLAGFNQFADIII